LKTAVEPSSKPTGYRDLNRLLACAEHADEVRVDVEHRRHALELLTRDVVRVLAKMRGGCVDCRHSRGIQDCMMSIRTLT